MPVALTLAAATLLCAAVAAGPAAQPAAADPIGAGASSSAPELGPLSAGTPDPPQHTVLSAAPGDAEPPPPARPWWLQALILLGCLVGSPVLAVLGTALRAGSSDRSAPRLPDGLRPPAAGLIHTRGRLLPRHLLAMVADMERRGLITAARSPEGAGEWRFAPRRPPREDASAADGALLELMFPVEDTASLDTLRARMDRRAVRTIRLALAEEGERLGIVVPRRRRLLFGTAFMLLSTGALAAPALLARSTGWQFSWLEAAGLVLLLWGALFGLLMPHFTTRYGARVTTLLDREARAAATGGPESPARHPAWAVALGAGGAGVPGGPGSDPAGAVDYHADPAYRTRWRDALHEPMGSPPEWRDRRSRGGTGGPGPAR